MVRACSFAWRPPWPCRFFLPRKALRRFEPEPERLHIFAPEAPGVRLRRGQQRALDLAEERLAWEALPSDSGIRIRTGAVGTSTQHCPGGAGAGGEREGATIL